MEPFLGQIQAFGFNFAPRGWAKCEGQLLAIAQYSALFSLLGTMYGGDGRTSFGLPDLRSRSIVGVGSGPGLDTITQGEKGGNVSTQLITANLPAHHHGINVSNANGSVDTAVAGNSIATTGLVNGRSFTPQSSFNTSTPNTALNAATCSNTGNNTSFSNRSPFLGINVCIALTGVFPSRN